MQIIKIINQGLRRSEFKSQVYTMSGFILIYAFSRMGVAYLYNPLLELLNQENYKTTIFIIVSLVGLSILSVYLLRRIQLMQVETSLQIERELTQSILRLSLCRSLLEIESEGLGSWLTHLSDDTKKYAQLIAQISMDIWLVIAKFLTALIFGLIISPVLTLSILIFSALSVVVPKYFSKKLVNHKEIEQESRDKLNETLLAALRSRDLIKVMKALTFTVRIFNKSYYEYNEYRLDYERVSFALQALSTGMSFIMTTFWIAVAFVMIQADQLTIGEFLGFMVLDDSFVSIFSQLPTYVSQAMGNYASYKRIKHLIVETKTYEKNEEIDSQFELLEAKGLAIYYPNFKLSLADLELIVEPGSKINIAGPSGSGKSTLLKMVTGLYPVNEGKICINHREVTDSGTLSNYMTYMPQMNAIFNETVRENILLGRSISNMRFNEIIETAGLRDWIGNLPAGANTVINKGLAQDLSEGQIQRIGFARALVKEAPIFILDEPTSALDEDNTQHLMNYIVQTKQAVLLVSHKQDLIPVSFERIDV